MIRATAPKRVLIVDDEQIIRRIVGAYLEGEATVRTAATVHEALVLLIAEPFDVALCDHYLGPGMTGAKLLDEIAARWPAVRRYLMSASDIPTQHNVLRKPFDLDALRDAVSR